jgi:hypothetical protein
VRLQYARALTDILTSDGVEITDKTVIDANTKMRAIGRVNYLRVTSGAEAMSLLLTSERVFTDMHDWLLYGEPEQVCMYVCIELIEIDKWTNQSIGCIPTIRTRVILTI